jgi:transketolase
MGIDKKKLTEFQDLAKKFRVEILETLEHAGSGHPGGSLSLVEIMIALYFYKLNVKPKEPAWVDRDRFILSKGHASPVMYVTLANAGFFPKDELKSFRTLGARLQGHVHPGVPGVELATGYLGQGLSVACGLAFGARLAKKNYSTFCVLGDGEIQEGQIWEAAMTAPHHKLGSLCAILDCNKVQENGLVKDIKNEEPIAEKWRAFGWNVIEIDGHDFTQIISALDSFDPKSDKPTFIVANTVKGKGVSFMEFQAKWHGKAPKKDELDKAIAEIGGM